MEGGRCEDSDILRLRDKVKKEGTKLLGPNTISTGYEDLIVEIQGGIESFQLFANRGESQEKVQRPEHQIQTRTHPSRPIVAGVGDWTVDLSGPATVGGLDQPLKAPTTQEAQEGWGWRIFFTGTRVD